MRRGEGVEGVDAPHVEVPADSCCSERWRRNFNTFEETANMAWPWVAPGSTISMRRVL